MVEPGHHYEWLWLLEWYQRMVEFAGLFGIEPEIGLVVNMPGNDGVVVDGGFRLWPQTEQLHAARGGAAIRCAAHGLESFLRPDGLWHERRRAGGVLSQEVAPAGSLYHLTTAIIGRVESADEELH